VSEKKKDYGVRFLRSGIVTKGMLARCFEAGKLSARVTREVGPGGPIRVHRPT
jgi:hypothetical protein